MIQFNYTKASTRKGAIESLARDPRSKFIAGGTNLVDLMKRGITTPERIIDIRDLPLKEIEEKQGVVRIGALALNSTVAEDPLIREKFPLLSMALNAGASPQIRNMATVGGNMMQRTRCPYFYDTALPCNKRKPGSGCSALNGYNRMHAILGASDQCIAVHPSDMCVALAALDAMVIVAGPKGERKIPFAGFHRLPGNQPDKDNTLERTELITAVEIRQTGAGQSYYLKIRDRASYAFALVSVAVNMDLHDGRIKSVRMALGGVAHKPWRSQQSEKMLLNQAPSVEVFRTAALMMLKGAKGYGHNNFKIRLAENAIVQALKTVTGISAG